MIEVYWHHFILIAGFSISTVVAYNLARPPDRYGIGGLFGGVAFIIINLFSVCVWLLLKYVGWT